MTADISGYKIVSTLGKGGMATVYLAVQEIFERKVALKVMSKALTADPTFGKRFMREAQIVSNLIHPNIVTVYDVGLNSGAYYLSMEYINGSDLKQARNTLSLKEKIQIVKDIALALNTLGQKGYVHRDIKPENIMIEKATKRAVLMDFGIARASENDVAVTQAGTAIGTPHYMSPEQAKGHDTDPRADLYSLGVVLFYLVAGYIPFEGDSAVAIGIRHITEPVPELPNEMKELQWFIDKTMAKDPEDRFQTGAEWVAALNTVDIDRLERFSNNAKSTQSADYDTPTIVGKKTTHQYGKTSQRSEEPESFTLSFKAITEEAASLQVRWPIYVTACCVFILLGLGFYLIKNHEPAPKEHIAAKAIDASAQGTIADLVIGRNTLTNEKRKQIDQLKEQVNAAQAQYNKTHSEQSLIALTKQSQILIAALPNSKQADQALSSIAEKHIQHIRSLFLEGQFKQAKSHLQSINTLFPEYRSEALTQLNQTLSLQPSLEQLLKTAKRHFKYERLTQPEGGNATHSYQQALALLPAFIPAQNGLNAISDELVKKASVALGNSDHNQAKELVHSALTLNAQNSAALTLEQQLLNLPDHQEKISALINQAERRIASLQFYQPTQLSAYDSYTQILAFDKHNKQAKSAKKALPKRLEESALNLVEKGDYEQATILTENAIASQPRNSDLMMASLNVEEAITSHRYNNQPRVNTIRASGTRDIQLDRQQPRAIAINDKIFFKFDYANLPDEKNSIRAYLYHADEDKPIGSQYVVVEGRTGKGDFIFDLAHMRAAIGEYRTELKLANTVIATLNFGVK